MKKIVIRLVNVLLLGVLVALIAIGVIRPLGDDWSTSSNLLGIVVVGAAIDSFNPCAFSVLLISIGFLLNLGASRRRTVGVGLLYVLGVFTVYTLIGLGILQALSFLNITNGFAKFAALILFAIGVLNVWGYYVPRYALSLGLSSKIKPTIAALIQKATIPSIFGLGVLVALFEFPCTGGPYLLVLSLLHESQTFWRGMGYLLLYNLIFIAPLLLIIVLATQQAMLQKIELYKKQHSAKMKLITGSIMIGLSVLILAL